MHTNNYSSNVLYPLLHHTVVVSILFCY